MKMEKEYFFVKIRFKQIPLWIFEIVNVIVQLYQRVATNKPPIKTDIAKDKTVALKEIRKCQTFKKDHMLADKFRVLILKKWLTRMML